MVKLQLHQLHIMMKHKHEIKMILHLQNVVQCKKNKKNKENKFINDLLQKTILSFIKNQYHIEGK